MSKLWSVSIWVYYAAVFVFVPHVSCQWPFNNHRLWFFGLIPLALAVVGLGVYRSPIERLLAWVVFGFAIVGICISYQPWCAKVGLPNW